MKRKTIGTKKTKLFKAPEPTPGEWRVLDALEERYVVSDQGVLIADCYADTHLDLSLPDVEEYESNARLIAQAPAMRNKLNQIEDIIVNHYGEEDEPFTKKHLKQILDSIAEVMDTK